MHHEKQWRWLWQQKHAQLVAEQEMLPGELLFNQDPSDTCSTSKHGAYPPVAVFKLDASTFFSSSHDQHVFPLPSAATSPTASGEESPLNLQNERCPLVLSTPCHGTTFPTP